MNTKSEDLAAQQQADAARPEGAARRAINKGTLPGSDGGPLGGKERPANWRTLRHGSGLQTVGREARFQALGRPAGDIAPAATAAGPVRVHRVAGAPTCPICGGGLADKVADHDHATGVARDWLCRLCNAGLGMFRDNPDALRAAADYIERHRDEPRDVLVFLREEIGKWHQPRSAKSFDEMGIVQRVVPTA
jgi:hypothetical protein